MKTKPFFYFALISLCLCLSVFAAKNILGVNKVLAEGQVCTLHQLRCLFSVDSKQFSIKFVQSPSVEQELAIKFTLPAGTRLGKVWIEGKNMYMGKTPVIFDTEANNGGDVSGLTFLGSCNLPEMTWQLNVQVINEKTEHIKMYSVLFTTSQN